MKPRNKMEPWMFAGPALVTYIFIVILPILWSLTYSFTDWNGVGRMNFIGLGNYIKMFDDKTLWIAFRNNIFFMITGTVFQLLMGLVMAILLSSIVKGSNLLRVSRASYRPWPSVKFLKNCFPCSQKVFLPQSRICLAWRRVPFSPNRIGR